MRLAILSVLDSALDENPALAAAQKSFPEFILARTTRSFASLP